MVLWEALDALSHELELCSVNADTRLVAMIDPTLDGDQLAGIQAAITRTAAQAISVHIAPEHCANNEPLHGALQAADVLITTGGHSPANLDADVRTLHLHSMPPQLFAPHASLKRRVHALSALLDDAATLAISDSNGTNVSVSLAGGATGSDYGFIDNTNHHASFPAGWVMVTPAAASVSGQVVLMPGDANLSAGRLIDSPVVLHILDDHVSAIDGDSPDADVVRALLEHPGEPSAYGIAGVTIGMNPGAAVAGPLDVRLLDPVVSRLLAGVVQLSFGENLVADRPCPQTISMALRGRDVHVDGLPVVRGGALEGDFAPDVYEL